jgi:predicted DNA binding CopG/RHH family protein
MKTHSKANVRKTRPQGGDAQVREFERRDLGDDIRASRTARVLRRVPKPTSILLDEDLVERLREKGAKRGLGYQTMLKLIVREHLEEY